MKKLVTILIIFALIVIVFSQLGSFVHAEMKKNAQRYENYMEMTE